MATKSSTMTPSYIFTSTMYHRHIFYNLTHISTMVPLRISDNFIATPCGRGDRSFKPVLKWRGICLLTLCLIVINFIHKDVYIYIYIYIYIVCLRVLNHAINATISLMEENRGNAECIA